MALLAAMTSACGLFEELPDVPPPSYAAENKLRNPGFEDGDAPWRIAAGPSWSPFAITDSVARTGTRSMELALGPGDAPQGTRVTGALQEIETDIFPEFISGYYRVDEWSPNAPFQYLQFAVVIRGGDFPDGGAIHEIRFPIAGAERQPLQLSNSGWVFLSRDQPRMGEWTYFGYPLQQAFETRWGMWPQRWDSIEVFFEVRYDGKTDEAAPSTAKVYYDDLYAGLQIYNPNVPDDFFDD